jgi:hypothetical protein
MVFALAGDSTSTNFMEAFDLKSFSGIYARSGDRRVAGNMGNATPPVKSLPGQGRVPMTVE